MIKNMETKNVFITIEIDGKPTMKVFSREDRKLIMRWINKTMKKHDNIKIKV